VSRPLKPKRITPGDGDPRHGTRNGYVNLGCRGADCTAAKTEYDRYRGRSVPGMRRRRVTDELLVTCWCEDGMVFVPKADVRRGRTASCGARGCAEPERLAS
jgi:hypothetical protein